MKHSNVEQARDAYRIPVWGEGYFDLDQDGEVCVRPTAESGRQVSLNRLVKLARSQGLRLPILFRFPQILEHRAKELCVAFDQAIAQVGYQNDFAPVYPIKVNQQHTVVTTLASLDGVGLEAGSKPELIAALAQASSGDIIVCNGYKDREYLRLALFGLLLGLTVYIVIEKPDELPLVLDESARMGVTPLLGVRIRLATIGAGVWQNSGGERAKFGLSASQLLQVVEHLQQQDQLDYLHMLHFHMGSQLSNIRDIHLGVREATRYLVELNQAGADIRVLDIGGGLAVDYEGSRSRGYCSMNYRLQQYAHSVVQGVAQVCDQHGIRHPRLISESGRALSAHHAVMVTNVTHVESVNSAPEPAGANEADVIANMRELLQEVETASIQEHFLEAQHFLEEGQNLFLYGNLDLHERALLERLYFALLNQMLPLLDQQRKSHRALTETISRKLADKLFINLSIFQSLPDIWGIDQVFPVLPVTGLDAPLQCRAVLEDLTCDSDGRIERFVDSGDIEATLRLPANTGGNALMAFFLLGAYQETLGDIHNLFGDTDSLDVYLDEQGELVLHNQQAGDSAQRVLQMVGFAPDQLQAKIAEKARTAGLDLTASKKLNEAIQASLSGYTYLEVADVS